MSYTTKQNESEARERLRAFWAGGSLGRPCLAVRVQRSDFAAQEWRERDDPKERELTPEYQVMMFENAIGQYRFLAESMPGFSARWGAFLVALAIFAGGDYEYDCRTAWIQPIEGIYDRALPDFDAEHPVAGRLETIFARLAQVAGDRAYINPPPMLDAMTTLSLFRGPGQLCLDVLERPNTVKRWCSRLTAMYIHIYDRFYRLVTSLGYGDTSSWLNVMAEGKMEAVQCDFATMLSPDMFREFVLPDLLRVTEYMDYSLYHLDGVEQLRFIDALRQCPKLNGIQWNPQPGAGSPLEWLDAFEGIRRRGFSLLVGCSVGEAVEICRRLGPDGLFLSLPVFGTQAEANQAVEEIAAAC